MKKTIAAISIAVIGSLACPVFLTAAEEKEEIVQMSSLSAAVQTTIKDKAGSNEIVKIEKKTEEGKTVYEAVVNKKGKEWSIEVDANGKFLKQFEESKAKKRKRKARSTNRNAPVLERYIAPEPMASHRFTMKKLFILAAISAATSSSALAALDTAKIDNLTGLKGKLNEKEGVYKITSPRSDVKVAVDGWTMPPFMGLGTWAAFTETKDGAMVMGDTVLFEDEVNPAMSVALENGLSVTALHNHFFFDHPKVYFMHIEGEGTTEQLATAVRKMYDKIKEIRAANPQPKDSFGATGLPEKNSISAEPLNKIFGMSGEPNNGMVKFTIGRPATMHGVKIDKEMGVNTWAAFAGDDKNAVVDGDFAVTEDELQPVLKSLLKNKIDIVAIHQHMTHEEPRIMFFHYWGRGSAKDLAQAVNGGLLVGGLLKVSSPIE